MKFKDILNEQNIDFGNNDKIIKFIKKLSPKTKIDFSKSGRKIYLQGPDDKAEIWVGVTNSKIFVRFSNEKEGENYSSDLSGTIDYALKNIDNMYSKKQFNKLKAIAKEGETD